VLSLAAKLGRPIDVHTDETLDPAVQHLSHLAGLVAETGVSHGVTASH
jgi:cytosine deaminase